MAEPACKLVEVRDRGTFIPVVAIKLSKADGRLAWRAGYGDVPCILLTRLVGNSKAYCDPYDWGDRTMTAAHLYIEKHFDSLSAGEVVDVRYALGESPEPCASEVDGPSVMREPLGAKP